MSFFENTANMGHESIHHFYDPQTGLKAIIAIHSTALGPAGGGCRMWQYKDEAQATRDALRLSRGMTYKNAMAHLPMGGGKAVILANPENPPSNDLFRAFGRFIDSLNGRYITAEDVGIDVNDMEFLFQETNNVVGVHQVKAVAVLDLSYAVENIAGMDSKGCCRLEINNTSSLRKCENLAGGNLRELGWSKFSV